MAVIPVAFQLVAEVLDHAPASLTAGEVVVLVALAEWSDADTRACWRPTEELQRRARVSPSGLRAVFKRLGERGLDPRQAAGTNPDGSPRYAWKGHASAFKLPRLPAPDGCACQQCRHHSGATEVPNGATVVHSAATVVRQSRHSSGAQSVNRQEPSSRARPHEDRAARLNLSTAEFERRVRDCRACGGTGKREDEHGRPTNRRCDHREVLGDVQDVWLRSGRPA